MSKRALPHRSLPNENRQFTRFRERLVEELREKDIDDERVLSAIGNVPRHLFVEQAFKHRAYEDEALPIGLKQTISQPFTVAYQTMLLNLEKGQTVLEIGTGSGYQAAVLCEMGAKLYTIERHEALYRRAKKILSSLKYHLVSKCGDGTLGWPAFAPFDKILVTAGALGIPEDVLKQLKDPGGQLVIPVGGKDGQVMKRITRTGPETYEEESLKTFRFVPLIGEGKLRR